MELKALPHQSLTPEFREHPFVRDFSPVHARMLEQCSSEWKAETGDYIWRQGEQADCLLLICCGQVALEIAVPLQPPLAIDLIGHGDVIGWSWLLPPYRRHFDARAVTAGDGFRVDGSALRDICERDAGFGYQFLKRFTPILVRRLEQAQRRLLHV